MPEIMFCADCKHYDSRLRFCFKKGIHVTGRHTICASFVPAYKSWRIIR